MKKLTSSRKAAVSKAAAVTRAAQSAASTLAKSVASSVASKVAKSAVVKRSSDSIASVTERAGATARAARSTTRELAKTTRLSIMQRAPVSARVGTQIAASIQTSITTKVKELSSQGVAKVARAREALSPRARGLSAAQMRELENRLVALQKELKESLEGKAGVFNTSVQPESVIKGDDAEVAEKQRMSNAALQELDFLKTRIQLVKRALAKIKAGVYGICEETEEPIGYERLTVVPWARFAVHVQEMHERKMRDYKVSRLRSEA